MGIGSIWHWLIVLAVIVLIFGTKKLKNVGSDLGQAVKGFKDGINGEGEAVAEKGGEKVDRAIAGQSSAEAGSQTIDVEVREKS